MSNQKSTKRNSKENKSVLKWESLLTEEGGKIILKRLAEIIAADLTTSEVKLRTLTTRKELAGRFQCSERLIQSFEDQGILRPIKIKHFIRYDWDEAYRSLKEYQV
jgi:hypothetical protein